MSKWVEIKDGCEMPKDEQQVLTCGVKGGIDICVYQEGMGFKYRGKGHYIDPVAWMPLPEKFTKQ